MPTAVAITSLSNPHLKSLVRLRDHDHRLAARRALVDGVRELGRAVAGGWSVEEVIVCESLLNEDGRRLVAALAEQGAIIQPVSAHAYHRLAYGERKDGVIGVVRIPELGLSRLRLPPHPLVVVLDGIEKPGNLGAVFRAADGAGADALVAASPRTDFLNPNVIRSSVGTVFTVPAAIAPSGEVRSWLVDHGLRIVVTRPDAPTLYTEVDLTGPVAIVLGNEATGLGRLWTALDAPAVRVPMLGTGDSLNVAVTAAILLYEARRQRGAPERDAVGGVAAPGEPAGPGRPDASASGGTEPSAGSAEPSAGGAEPSAGGPLPPSGPADGPKKGRRKPRSRPGDQPSKAG
jgi:TrmH family RNA methyltransferase